MSDYFRDLNESSISFQILGPRNLILSLPLLLQALGRKSASREISTVAVLCILILLALFPNN